MAKAFWFYEGFPQENKGYSLYQNHLDHNLYEAKFGSAAVCRLMSKIIVLRNWNQ